MFCSRASQYPPRNARAAGEGRRAPRNEVSRLRSKFQRFPSVNPLDAHAAIITLNLDSEPSHEARPNARHLWILQLFGGEAVAFTLLPHLAIIERKNCIARPAVEAALDVPRTTASRGASWAIKPVRSPSSAGCACNHALRFFSSSEFNLSSPAASKSAPPHALFQRSRIHRQCV